MTTGPRIVEIREWTPDWGDRFVRAKAELLSVLPPDVTIEHIGSTSVPGLPAKPIIDILVTTHDLGGLLANLEPIEQLGYRYNPAAFGDDQEHAFLRRDTAGARTEHLHIFHAGSRRAASNRTFRDYLMTHPDEARGYADVKKRLAETYPTSRGEYGRAKEPVLLTLLARAMAWANTSEGGSTTSPAPAGD